MHLLFYLLYENNFIFLTYFINYLPVLFHLFTLEEMLALQQHSEKMTLFMKGVEDDPVNYCKQDTILDTICASFILFAFISFPSVSRCFYRTADRNKDIQRC